MAKKTTEATLRHVADTLKAAELGLVAILTGHPEQKMAGLRNVVVFGRAVTNVLQNLRSTEPQFDEWYQPFVEEMMSDPLLKYFYDLRTEILKVGSTRTVVATHISNFSPARDMHKFGPPPPGATRFFIGDQLGGTGWEIPQDDGSTERYYVGLPGDIGTVSVHLVNVPQSHLSRALPASTIEALSAKYLEYIKALVQSAKARFGKPGT